MTCQAATALLLFSRNMTYECLLTSMDMPSGRESTDSEHALQFNRSQLTVRTGAQAARLVQLRHRMHARPRLVLALCLHYP